MKILWPTAAKWSVWGPDELNWNSFLDSMCGIFVVRGADRNASQLAFNRFIVLIWHCISTGFMLCSHVDKLLYDVSSVVFVAVVAHHSIGCICNLDCFTEFVSVFSKCQGVCACLPTHWYVHTVGFKFYVVCCNSYIIACSKGMIVQVLYCLSCWRTSLLLLDQWLTWIFSQMKQRFICLFVISYWLTLNASVQGYVRFVSRKGASVAVSQCRQKTLPSSLPELTLSAVTGVTFM